MIISKDLFIFGEQIFATIIPESVLPPSPPSAPPPLQQQQQVFAIGTSVREPQGDSFETATSATATASTPAPATTTKSKSSLPSPPSSAAAIKKPTATATTKSSADKQEITVANVAAASVLSGPTSAASPATRFNTGVGQLAGGLNLHTHTQAGATPRRKEKTLTRRSREATIKVATTTATTAAPASSVKSGDTSGSVPPQCGATESVESYAEGELDEGEEEAIPLSTDDKRRGEKEPLVQQRNRAKIIAIPAAGAGPVDEPRINSPLTHQYHQHQRQHQSADTAGSNSSYHHNALEEATTTAATATAVTTATGDKEHPTDFILNMGKVNLGNNNNATRTDHAMVTIPFIAESPNHTHLQLSFQNINVLHNDRKILSDVSGLVSPGEVLAVMGPSGSGKTTLLDCLSGQRRIDSGSIYLNREPVSKKWRRKICYVLQEEIFFAGLTLRETVTYTALLRLPEKMPKAEKMKQVDRLLEELELGFCQQTKFGDYLNRGLSGGEKKRANIACELLTNPLLMLLDEPTSGLDSHSAISLMKILKRYAIQEQKTVVITVHQPSSQMFHMFDKLLLLYNGRTAYFGEVNNIYKYFEDIGVTIKPHYNPADFVLEQLKSYPDIREKLFLAAKESHHNFLNRNCLAVNSNSTPKVKSVAVGEAAKSDPPHDALINDIIKNYYKEIENSSNHHLGHDTMLMIANNRHNNHHQHNEACEDPAQQLWCGADSQSNFSSASSDYHHQQHHYDTAGDWFDYPTRFHTQFRVLSSRNFKEAKPRMLSKLNWFQTIGLALMAGAIWFQIPRTEEFLHDLQGWMFFSQTYWMLFALFGALNSFPSEREVISKERRSGAYRLSAYYLAKMFGELPLVVTLPTVYLMISYPMLGCTSFKLFSLMLVFLLLNTIVAQSVGFFIGACCMDMNVSITLSALYTLATQLFGGYLSSRIPEGLSWIRYTSMIHYAYQNMQILEFREGSPIRCGDPSSYEICKSSSNPQAPYIPYDEILRAQNSTSPLWLNTCILMMFFVVFRSLGYAVLRYIRCPKT